MIGPDGSAVFNEFVPVSTRWWSRVLQSAVDVVVVVVVVVVVELTLVSFCSGGRDTGGEHGE